MKTPYNQSIICPALIGRVPQLDALRQCIDAAGSGRGMVAFVSGEAGVGKTRLITEATAYALAQGCQVLRGACFPHDAASPYALFVDLLHTQFIR